MEKLECFMSYFLGLFLSSLIPFMGFVITISPQGQEPGNVFLSSFLFYMGGITFGCIVFFIIQSETMRRGLNG